MFKKFVTVVSQLLERTKDFWHENSFVVYFKKICWFVEFSINGS